MLNTIFIRFGLFLVINFLALYLGNILMNNGPKGEWYLMLNKAPWTPPGWVFGLSWSLIMVCFAIYMTQLSFQFELFNKKLLLLFTIQWFLNVMWNAAFFNHQNIILGLIMIVLLWLLIGYFIFEYTSIMKFYTLLIAPYWIWMIIATSLNAYIFFYN